MFGGAGLTLTLILTIRFKACVTMVTVMVEVTNGKVIGLLYDLHGLKFSACLAKKQLDMKSGTPMMTLKY